VRLTLSGALQPLLRLWLLLFLLLLLLLLLLLPVTLLAVATKGCLQRGVAVLVRELLVADLAHRLNIWRPPLRQQPMRRQQKLWQRSWWKPLSPPAAAGLRPKP